MRLIDVDALIETMRENAEGNEGWYGDTWAFMRDVENAPTIDPVRHGRWVVIDAEEPRRYGCSECKRLSWHMENYCPNCGAKMDGGDTDA